MRNIKPGDRVLCINDFNHKSNGIQSALKKGREYIVYSIYGCGCGISYDVGLLPQTTPNKNVLGMCPGCGRIEDNNIHWAATERFVKVKENVQYKAVHSNIKIEEPALN